MNIVFGFPKRIVKQDEQNKLEMADVMIADAIKLLGMDKHFVIDCDDWYSKASPLIGFLAKMFMYQPSLFRDDGEI